MLFAWNLERSPIYLHHDEILFALQAHAIAATGHDTNGRLFPLYFEMVPGNWFQPTLVYWMAVFFKVLPLSTFAVRFPSTLVGAVDVVLMYFVARTLFKKERFAILAALLLIVTPAHYIHARLGMDYLYPVPFVLAWLLCLLHYLEHRRLWLVGAGTLMLGLGFFTYLASVVMMPIYFLVTCVVLLKTRAPVRAYGTAVVGFGSPLLLLVAPFLLTHPHVINDFIRRYHVYDTAHLNMFQGLHEFLNFTSLTQRAYLYWMYFNPSFFFFSGGSNVVNATRQAGVFLLPVAVLLPVGIYRAGSKPVELSRLILLVGFATGPLAALLVDEEGAIDRMLNILPFAILLTALGVETLLAAEPWSAKALAAALLVALPLQFGSFVADYFGDYRVRSSVGFEANLSGALEDLIARDRSQVTPKVYLSQEIPYVDFQWKWYVIRRQRGALLERTVYYRPSELDVASIPAGSLMIVPVIAPAEQKLLADGRLRAVADFKEPNGDVSFRTLTK